jgi:integrase/recombinase XerD
MRRQSVDYTRQFEVYQRVEIGKGEKTVAAYTDDVKRFGVWLDTHAALRGLPPSWEDVSARHIRAYTSWLSTERTQERKYGTRITLKPVGAKYLRRITASLRVWFDYLREVEQLRTDNPAREIKAPKLPKRHPGALSTDEISRLIQAAVEHSRIPERLRNWTLIAFLFHTGLRVSELCELRVSDVKYRDHLPHSLRVIGKGNKERRVILSTEAKRALYQWLQERAHIEAAAPLEADASYVWLVPAGKKRGEGITPAGVRALLRRLAPLANLTKNVHSHLLRHSFATEAVRRGAKIHGLKEMLGHASIATTGVYLHADEDELEQVAAVMPSTASYKSLTSSSFRASLRKLKGSEIPVLCSA